MKKLFFLFLLSLTVAAVNAQIVGNPTTTCIVSDLNWRAATTQAGPYTLPVFNVDLCTNDCVVECICGPNYEVPHIDDHFADCCPGVTAIWGSPSPANCIFPVETWWFQRTFNYNATDCTRLLSAIATIQGDQRYRFFLNGNLIGTSGNTQWSQAFTYNVNPQPGLNTIQIEVANIGGGTCFNYAFLAFCLEITTAEVDPGEPCFNYSTVYDARDNEYDITATPLNTGAGVNHEWIVNWGTSLGNYPNTLGYFGPDVPVLNFQVTDNFTGCRYYEIIHRVYVDGMEDCGRCCITVIAICDTELGGGGELGGGTGGGEGDGIGERTEVNCGDLFDEFHFGLRSNGDTGKTQLDIGTMKVSPNPALDVLNVQWNDIKAASVKVLNFSGQVLLEKSVTDSQNNIELQVATLPAGMYVVELTGLETGKKLTQIFSVTK